MGKNCDEFLKVLPSERIDVIPAKNRVSISELFCNYKCIEQVQKMALIQFPGEKTSLNQMDIKRNLPKSQGSETQRP
jgi:hypothetical protein